MALADVEVRPYRASHPSRFGCSLMSFGSIYYSFESPPPSGMIRHAVLAQTRSGKSRGIIDAEAQDSNEPPALDGRDGSVAVVIAMPSCEATSREGHLRDFALGVTQVHCTSHDLLSPGPDILRRDDIRDSR